MVKQNTPKAKPGKKPAKAGVSRTKSQLKAGRPTLSESADRAGGRSPMLALRLPPDEMAAVDDLAKREGVPRSEIVRRLIAAGRLAYKPGKQAK